MTPASNKATEMGGLLETCDRLKAEVERLEKDAKRNSEVGKAELAMLREQHEQTKAQLRVIAEHAAVHDRECCNLLAAPILAGRSTVTPADWTGHQRDRAQPGATVEELRAKYGLTEEGKADA